MAALEAKLARKDALIAKISEEYVQLEKGVLCCSSWKV